MLIKIISDQNRLVVVSALYATVELMSWNRDQIVGYFEVQLKGSLSFLEKRDDKGLYGPARRGELRDVVGVDIPWLPPNNSELCIDAELETPPDELAQQVLAALPAELLASVA